MKLKSVTHLIICALMIFPALFVSPFTSSVSADTTTPIPNQAPYEPIIYDCSSQSQLPLGSCQALVALYNNTNGPGWKDHTDWLATTTPCSWYGVSCYGGQVEYLALYTNQLSGTIPPELGNLTNLVILGLADNQLTGSIPPELGNLTNLVSLNLNDNQLSGEIPPQLSNLTNLREMNLHQNYFLNGAVPSEFGNLTNLLYLSLSFNQLSGAIPPELGNLVNLTQLNFTQNQLSGTIPPELGNLVNLTRFEVSVNKLTGDIPVELGNLINLGTLNLRKNQLSGTIPPELGNLTKLTRLELGENKLSGQIPPELGSLTNLEYLFLGGNSLSGSIPPELGNLGNLRSTSLGANSLSGTIPPELGNLGNLTSLDLGYNQLIGTIPVELGNLANLTGLSMGGNLLSGAVPSELGNLSNLQRLRLNNNPLSGPIPLSFVNLTGITIFWFEDTVLCEPDNASFQAWKATVTDWAGTGLCYNISGHISDGINPLKDATISTDVGIEANSGADGTYTIYNLPPGSYSLSASKTDYIFSPPSLDVTITNSDQTGAVFTGVRVYSISGRVTDLVGNGIAGVLVSIEKSGVQSLQMSSTTITDANGDYILGGLIADTYTLTFSKSGYVFLPVPVTVTNASVEDLVSTPSNKLVFLPMVRQNNSP